MSTIEEIVKDENQSPFAIFQAAAAKLQPYIGKTDFSLDEQLQKMNTLAAAGENKDVKATSRNLGKQIEHFISIFTADDQEEIRERPRR